MSVKLDCHDRLDEIEDLIKVAYNAVEVNLPHLCVLLNIIEAKIRNVKNLIKGEDHVDE